MKQIFTSLLLPALLRAATLARAEEKPVLHYDFSSVSGTTVTDVSGTGIDATLRGAATVEQMGEYAVLNLGNANGYLDMGAAAGELFSQLSGYTISMYYRVGEDASLSGNGYFLWNWSNSVSSTAGSGAYSAYRLNNQHMANATAGYGTEQVIAIGRAASKGLWYHVAYKQQGKTGKLYINGSLVGSNTSMHTNADMFDTAAPQYCFIGRAPFGDDNYLKQTLVYDVRLYSSALPDADIRELAGATDKLDYAYRYGQAGDFTSLRTALAEAQTFLANTDLGTYPPSAVAEFEDVVGVCRSISDEGLATQTIIDDYLSMLGSARVKLDKAKGFVFDLSGLRTDYDTDRGFRHPGGLHTYQDFERIRRQIAAGNPDVTAAYDLLKSSFFAQSTGGHQRHGGGYPRRCGRRELHQLCPWCPHGLPERTALAD